MLSFRPDGILFDCDSTLSRVEGIDELARLKGCHTEIAKLTDAAMNGSVKLEDVYCKRLDIIRPQRQDLAHIAQHYLQEVTPGAVEIVQALKAKHLPIGIVSGGLREAILPLARHLGFHDEDVFAVSLNFDDAGEYQSVAPSPLTTAHGKYDIVQQWKQQHQLKRVVLIGDGASDVAAQGAAEAVIGYGGIIKRENVVNTATLFYEALDLQGILPLLNLY